MKLTTDAGYRLTYHVYAEAYYAQRGRDEELWIQKAADEGGVSWEFGAVQVGNVGVRVNVFDDAWAVFTEIPAFFAELARAGKGTTLKDVQSILDDLGFVDATQRTEPGR